MLDYNLSQKNKEIVKFTINSSRLFYTPLSILFIGYYFIKHRQEIINNITYIGISQLLTIILFIAIGHFFISLSTFYILKAQNQKISFSKVYSIHINRIPARYLPGGIWQTVARASDFLSGGLSKTTVAKIVSLEISLAIWLAGIMGSSLLIYDNTTISIAILIIIMMFSIAGLVTTPYLVLRESRPEGRTWRPSSFTAAILSFLIVWLVYGSAFFLYLSNMFITLSWHKAVGVYLLSWLAGYLAFFAPQGIGVFEATSNALLTGHFISEFLVAIFGFRALSIVADLLVWLVFRILFHLNYK